MGLKISTIKNSFTSLNNLQCLYDNKMCLKEPKSEISSMFYLIKNLIKIGYQENQTLFGVSFDWRLHEKHGYV